MIKLSEPQIKTMSLVVICAAVLFVSIAFMNIAAKNCLPEDPHDISNTGMDYDEVIYNSGDTHWVKVKQLYKDGSHYIPSHIIHALYSDVLYKRYKVGDTFWLNKWPVVVVASK